jgi:hypothetical protein
MKKYLQALMIFLSLFTLFFAFVPSTALAEDGSDGRIRVDVTKFPELTNTRVGRFEGDNWLDPRNRNYNPSAIPKTPRFTELENPSPNSNIGRPKQLPFPGDGEYGTNIAGGNQVEFTSAYQKVDPTITLFENNDVLYAPTLMGPDYSRLESVAAYYRIGTTTYRQWMVFEHSTSTPGQGSWVFNTPMDSSFTSRYVSAANEVITKVVKFSGPAWNVYLYDLIDSEWDQLLDSNSSGSSTYQAGWDWWEQYNLANLWPNLPQLKSRYLLVQVSGTPYFVTSTYGSKRDQGSINYPKNHVSDFYEWYVGPGP